MPPYDVFNDVGACMGSCISRLDGFPIRRIYGATFLWGDVFIVGWMAFLLWD